MTKKDMARAIAEETGIPQVQVTAIVQRIFDGITRNGHLAKLRRADRPCRCGVEAIESVSVYYR